MNVSQRQEFCVRWNSHLGSIGAAFPQLLAGQRFVDVTLACEGHQVHCHRLVLAACSSYFDSILAENPCKHPVIILPSEIKLWEIQALVDFMYKGEVNVTQAGLPQLLRCAEQLRIRGLYGTDAALNLNQLKALTKVNTPTNAASGVGNNSGMSANMPSQMSSSNDITETDDTATNSTSTTTTTSNSTASVIQQPMNNAANMAVAADTIIKKEPELINCNNGNAQLQNLMHQQQQQQLQQQQQQQRENAPGNSSTVNSNAPTEDDSNDDSNSNAAYDQFDDYAANNKAQLQQALHMDSTIEDDHNYVAHDDDDSFGNAASSALDTEHETSGNASMLHSSMDGSGSYKRVRRSEASLAQAAKCVSKGQTFQTVSNMFNIPVSTIRFYMARKGILPKRKRGRGALQQSTTVMSNASALSNAVMSEALAQMKRAGAASPTALEAQYHLLAAAGAGNAAANVYKMNEQQATTAANLI